LAHAGELGAIPHSETCEVCAARERAAAAGLGWLGRARLSAVAWLARVNGTPVADIGRGDLGAIRRLAEA
jgi:hypothetical protein